MERSYKKRVLLEIIMKIVFLAAACMSVLCVALICIFLFANGLPAMGEIGVLNFLSGTRWKPGADIYGIFPMILGSIYVTAGALLMGVPVALLTAIYLAFFCPQKLYRVLKPAVELLAGIPSVVYGFFGIVVLVPMVRALGEKWDGSGNSMLTASILLAIMILPLIMRTTEEALKSVPDSYREGSFGLGAGRLRTVFRIVLPSAMPGILAGIILAIGRIVGETAALLYTAGTVANYPRAVAPAGSNWLQQGLSVFMSSGRTLSLHMYVLSGEALYIDQAYATAVVLLVVVIGINALSSLIAKKITKG